MNAHLSRGVLFTDQYQLTMGQVYFRLGLHEQTARFEHFFRHYPNYGSHAAGYCINAGLEPLLEWMQTAQFGAAEIAALEQMRGRSGAPLFAADYLRWLAQHGDLRNLSLAAIPEGRVVHPGVPLTVVEGPLGLAQLLETPLLNMLNFSTLIATKAARVRHSAEAGLVLEFGLRRAQGRGGNQATRAALIGGADRSSNVGMSMELGVQPSGTHAHSLVQMAIANGLSELDAFRAFAETYPDDTLLLVDTVNTLESGVPNAITVFEELRRKGHTPIGIRLDSGDLAYLSVQAARLLNAAGFNEVAIVLSNNLDELTIWQIRDQIRQEAPRAGVDVNNLLGRLVWGVGTHLVTSWGEPALGGVYKLVAVEREQRWVPAIKLSENPQKTPTPGRKRAWRMLDARGLASADVLALFDDQPQQHTALTLHHPIDLNKARVIHPADYRFEELIQPVLVDGKRVAEPVPLAAIRAQRVHDVQQLDPGVARLINPHIYHVSLTKPLWELKQELIQQMREV